jgi:hypothetical protein
MAAFDIAQIVSDPTVQESFLSGLSVEPWRKLEAKDGGGITIAGLSTGGMCSFKGEHMVRLAYRINNTFAKAGKTKATLVLTPKTAATFVKFEKLLKDKIVASGMMKSSEMKASFQSAVEKTDKYPAHTMKINVRIEQPLTTFFKVEENEVGEKKPTAIMWNDVQKFALMNCRFTPSMIWKGQGGKCAITYQAKVCICAYEETMPTPLDEEHLVLNMDELETDEFMEEMDTTGKEASFAPDKFMPKGGKSIKGARGPQGGGGGGPDEEFQTKSTVKKAAGKKKAPEPDLDDDVVEMSANGGASATPSKPPKAPQKRPRKSTKVTDMAPSDSAVLAMDTVLDSDNDADEPKIQDAPKDESEDE